MPVSDGTNSGEQMRFFAENKFFIVLVIVSCSQLHFTKFRTKHLIHDKFPTDDFSKNFRRCSTKFEKLGTIIQSNRLKKFVPNRPTICSLFLSSKTILDRRKISSSPVICLVSSIS